MILDFSFFLYHFYKYFIQLSGDHFPLEARHHLAPWLDQNFTTDLDLANPQHEEHAQRLVLELVAQLESKVEYNKNYFGCSPRSPNVSMSVCVSVTLATTVLAFCRISVGLL